MYNSCDLECNKTLSATGSKTNNANIHFKMAIGVFETKFVCLVKEISGPGSSVGIATHYGLDGLGIESRWGARFCSVGIATELQAGRSGDRIPVGRGDFAQSV